MTEKTKDEDIRFLLERMNSKMDKLLEVVDDVQVQLNSKNGNFVTNKMKLWIKTLEK